LDWKEIFIPSCKIFNGDFPVVDNGENIFQIQVPVLLKIRQQ
jgi:hypothetical protein